MRSAAPSAPLEASSFVSFDRGVRANAWWQRPDRYRHLEHGGEGLPRIARGGGLSYAAASFGEGLIVQDMKAFDRFLEFDGLAKVRVEAGMTFTKLLSVLARRGCSIPVVPGHPLITVGGAVAADVHGKHPARDGTFADWVECLTLYHPEIGFATLSREREPERFAATCGGFGLTGTIVDVTLRVAPLRSTRVKVEAAPLASLRAAIEPLQASADEDFVYTWHDGTARGHDFGRGVVFRGRFIDDLAPTHALVVDASRGRPWSMPMNMWTAPVTRTVNRIFRTRTTAVERRVVDLASALFPFARQSLYHRAYGKGGFCEMQLLIPWPAADAFVHELGGIVQRHAPPLVMMSAKPFRGGQTALSLSGDGLLLALDMVRSESAARAMCAIDAAMLATGGQPNVVKDSRLPRAVAAQALPAYQRFREHRARWDPNRMYRSELSSRLDV